MSTHEQFLAKLEALGVDAVKERIATNQYPSEFRNVAQGWVEQKEAALGAEQMAHALRAHRDARWANWIAIVAVVIAAISLIVAVFK
jgi:t-SNARE complex subunit (syntaxin)